MSFYSFCCGLVRIYYKVMYKVEINGVENLPSAGGCVLCCNHKSNHDAAILASFLPRQLNFLAKEELFVPVFGQLIKTLGAISLKRGSSDIAAIKQCLKVLKEDKALLIFPQGTRCKSIKQEDFKPGSLPIAHRVKVPVIPIGINGEYKFRNKIKINIGAPITVDEIGEVMQTEDDKLRNTQLANLLYMRIKELAEG